MDPYKTKTERMKEEKNTDLEDSYKKSNVGMGLKAKRLDTWAGHVWREL